MGTRASLVIQTSNLESPDNQVIEPFTGVLRVLNLRVEVQINELETQDSELVKVVVKEVQQSAAVVM